MSGPDHIPITDTMKQYLDLFDLWAEALPWEKRKLRGQMDELVGEMLPCG